MDNQRIQEFEARRAKLRKMSDEELKKRFWELCEKAVQPMVELSKTHTSPSIERSVLMRMGVDTFTAMGVVAKIHETGLLGKGAGHVVLKVSQKLGIGIPEAAKKINESPEVLKGLF